MTMMDLIMKREKEKSKELQKQVASALKKKESDVGL